jgi:hypothetical protein
MWMKKAKTAEIRCSFWDEEIDRLRRDMRACDPV